MKYKFEAWADDDGVSLVASDNVKWQQENNLLGKHAKFLHSIEADTHEEAMAVHHIKMGWEPYKPMGEAKSCPKGCGAYFYPEGSGECPKCGKIC
ncbi:MAG: hypothetical protein COB30_019995 [Ectothiorhodospiraceae bacterium]|nr:hypothetical protein [Ectothiorhodospiraceae bacterium]